VNFEVEQKGAQAHTQVSLKICGEQNWLSTGRGGGLRLQLRKVRTVGPKLETSELTPSQTRPLDNSSVVESARVWHVTGSRIEGQSDN